MVCLTSTLEITMSIQQTNGLKWKKPGLFSFRILDGGKEILIVIPNKDTIGLVVITMIPMTVALKALKRLIL